MFRDEPQSNGGVIGKEVCDLLVVFEKDVVLFSDKDCAFPDTGNLDLDWARWYRRAVKKSAAQLRGAERWICKNPGRLFLDPSCKVPFPLAVPVPPDRVVHRVLVAHGAAARCRKELGGSGTLIVRPDIVGERHCVPKSDGGEPFSIGRVDEIGAFIHVFDEVALLMILSVLDTASDFILYLRKREAFLRSGRLGRAMGEEALIGVYMATLNESGEHDFMIPDDGPPVRFDEGWWTGFLQSPELKRKLNADGISYLWDHLIEKFTKHFMDGTAEHLSEPTNAGQDQILRFFARENRTRRRMLASSLVDMIKITPPELRRLRVLQPSRSGDPYWVLLILPHPEWVSLGDYRAVRRRFLEACCMVTKLEYPDAQDIVGFATETSAGPGRSEDALYLDAREWNDELAREARELRSKLNILTSGTMIGGTEYEYPPG